MHICNYVSKNTRLHSSNLSKHMNQSRILNYIPIISGKSILTTLIKHAIQYHIPFRIFSNIKCHHICTRTKPHCMKIFMTICISKNRTRARVILKIPKNLINLITHYNRAIRIFILAFLTNLIAISFTNSTVSNIPRIPNMRMQLRKIRSFLLINPQNLINCIFNSCLTQSYHWNWIFGKIISINYMKNLLSMSRSPIFPLRTDFKSTVTKSIINDINTILYKQSICITHNNSSYINRFKDYSSL